MPLIRKIEPNHVFMLTALFIGAWVYTEVSEYIDRQRFAEEVSDFMHKGDRFTQEEGDAMERRLDIIEARLEAIDRHHMSEAHPLEMLNKKE